MFDYSEIAETANEILAEFGQAFTLTHAVPGTYSPATGSVTNATTTQNGMGALLDYNAHQAGIFNAPGSLAKVGDKQLLLSPLKTDGAALVEPVPGDTVTDAAGKVWTINQVKAVSPAGTPVLYDCNLRA